MIEHIKRFLENFAAKPYVIKETKSEEGIDGRLISCVDKGSSIAEQYKVLRTNLYSLAPDKHIKSILITSSHTEEGKTVTSSNLAYSLSLSALKKTILIDGDLRRPSIHKVFSIDRKPGFSDILQGTVNVEQFIDKPAVGNLFIIPAGSMVSSPAEILGQAKIKEVIEKLKTKFDYIIFDSPPVLTVTDTSVLGAACDAVILVVKAQVTPRGIIEEAFNTLKNAQAKPLACIITNFSVPQPYYYFNKYKYYYKYSYADPKDTI